MISPASSSLPRCPLTVGALIPASLASTLAGSARPLANAETMVITAADADHPSFGCRDGAKWTYFGDAFFNIALRGTPNLKDAFALARTLVRKRELRNGFAPSNPQMAGGEDLEHLLRRASKTASSAAVDHPAILGERKNRAWLQPSFDLPASQLPRRAERVAVAARIESALAPANRASPVP